MVQVRRSHNVFGLTVKHLSAGYSEFHELPPGMIQDPSTNEVHRSSLMLDWHRYSDEVESLRRAFTILKSRPK
jgi:hypothetical protein